MWAPLVRVAFGLSWAAHMASSKSIAPRQEQCASATSDAERAACSMLAAFGGSSIIPQIMPDFSPKAALSVKYGDVVIGGAQQMSPSKVVAQPSLSLSFISNNPQLLQQTYLILGLEYQPKSKSVTPFWLQTSVKIDKATGDMTSPVAPMVKYKSPNPSQGSGTHEYIFLVFQDPGLGALSNRDPQIAAMISGASDFLPFLASLKPSNSVIAGSFFKSTFDGIPVLPTPKEKAPQSPPATTRTANQSTAVQPDATVRSEPQTPKQSFQTSPSPDTLVPSATQNSALTQSAGSNQTETGQNSTSSSASNLISQKYSTPLLVATFIGISLL